jgi:hypothetical protein
MCVER